MAKLELGSNIVERGSYPALVSALIDLGAEVNFADIRGRTPLHFGAGNKDPAVVARLLDAGADPNATDTSGDTPLHLAVARNQKSEAISLLLDAGADPTLQDIGGRTPWDAAQGNEDLKGAEVLDLLKPGGF